MIQNYPFNNKVKFPSGSCCPLVAPFWTLLIASSNVLQSKTIYMCAKGNRHDLDSVAVRDRVGLSG